MANSGCSWTLDPSDPRAFLSFNSLPSAAYLDFSFCLPIISPPHILVHTHFTFGCLVLVYQLFSVSVQNVLKLRNEASLKTVESKDLVMRMEGRQVGRKGTSNVKIPDAMDQT